MKEISDLIAGLFDSTNLRRTAFSAKRKVTAYEIELFESDYFYCVINGEKIRYRKNTLVIARPGDERYSKLHFACRYAHVNLSGRLKDFFDSCPHILSVSDPSAYVEALDALSKIENEDEDYFSAMSALYRIAALVKRDTQLNRSTANSSAKADGLFAAAALMEKNYARKITLSSLAHLANMHPNYFSAAFKKLYEVSPMQYLLGVRLRAARYLLITTGKSVGEIAALTGFDSQTYFSHRFRLKYGISPKAYRDKYERSI